LLDTLRAMVDFLNKKLYSKHMNYIDVYIYKKFSKCKQFLKNNDDIFVTKLIKAK